MSSVYPSIYLSTGIYIYLSLRQQRIRSRTLSNEVKSRPKLTRRRKSLDKDLNIKVYSVCVSIYSSICSSIYPSLFLVSLGSQKSQVHTHTVQCCDSV